MTKARPAATRPPSFTALHPAWQACLRQAHEAYLHGSLPIGAAIVDASGEVIAVGRNRLTEPHPEAPHLPGTPYLTGTPLAHAEVNALLQMGYERPDPRPTLYTTTEPCPLCMGAARMAGVGRVVFATRDPWAGAASMAESVPYLARVGPRVEGPEPALEAALAAWLVASGGWSLRSGAFVDAWRERHPRALAAGARLRESGALRAAAEQGAEHVWRLLNEALPEADLARGSTLSDGANAPDPA